MKTDTLKQIEKNGIVAILRGYAPNDTLKICEALLKGGINCMEMTYIAHGNYEETASTVRLLNEHFGNEMCVGNGTVLFPEQVKLTYEAGGKYIVSPNTNPEIISLANSLRLVTIPGAFTPTECEFAHEAGADYVKIFPVNLLGAKYMKTISAPLSHIKFMAVGSLELADIPEYINSGVTRFGIGASLGFAKAVETGDFSIVTQRAMEYVSVLKG